MMRKFEHETKRKVPLKERVKGFVNQVISEGKERSEERRNLNKIYKSKYEQTLKVERRKQAHLRAERDAERKAHEETHKPKGKGLNLSSILGGMEKLSKGMDKAYGLPAASQNPLGIGFGFGPPSSKPRKKSKNHKRKR